MTERVGGNAARNVARRRGITQRELLKQRVSQLEAEDAKRRFQVGCSLHGKAGLAILGVS